jgi:CheY-specific phosphatase CheX
MKEYQKVFEVIDDSVVTTFKSIYKTMTGLDVKPFDLKNLNDFTRNYSTTMGLNGYFTNDKNEKLKFRASAVITWQIESYLKMASRIMGEEYKEFCADINDVGMEVLNTTVGNSKPLLSKNNVVVEMSLPTGFVGNQFFVESSTNIYSKMHIFDTEIGKLCVVVNFLVDI